MFDIIAGVDGISAEPGKVFHDYAVYMTGFNIGEHLLKGGTVKGSAAHAVVDIGIINANLRVALQICTDNQLLCFNRCGSGMLILHRKTDINSSMARGICLRQYCLSGFFSALSCQCLSHLSVFDLFSLCDEFQCLGILIFVGECNFQLRLAENMDALNHVYNRFAV